MVENSIRNKEWASLSAIEKAEIMKIAIQNGISDLESIKNAYNSFADGGPKESKFKSTYRNGDKYEESPECAYFSNHTLNNQGYMMSGNAWNPRGADMVFNGFDGLERPSEFNQQKYDAYLQKAVGNIYSNFNTRETLDPSEVYTVNMYYKPSPNKEKAYNEGDSIYGTHTGYLNYDPTDDTWYVTHNIHNQIHRDRFGNLQNPNNNIGVTAIMKPRKNNIYNKVKTKLGFADGGYLNPISDSEYYSIMEKVAKDNWKRWGYSSEEEALINVLNDNTYNYREFYNKYPNSEANADTHWTDEFKTVNNPTFSNESIYSPNNPNYIGKSQYNPNEIPGGYWLGDTHIPTIVQMLDMEKRKFDDGGYIPSYTIKDRIARWEGKAMTQSTVDPLSGKVVKKNNSFENEARNFYSVLPDSIKEQVLSNQELADNLFSYSYNVGAHKFKKRVVPALERYYSGNGSIEEIENSMWASGDSQLRGLQKRRAEERAGVRNALSNNRQVARVQEEPIRTTPWDSFITEVPGVQSVDEVQYAQAQPVEDTPIFFTSSEATQDPYTMQLLSMLENISSKKKDPLMDTLNTIQNYSNF